MSESVSHPDFPEMIRQGEMTAAQIDFLDMVDKLLGSHPQKELLDLFVEERLGRGLQEEMLRSPMGNMMLSPGKVVFPGKSLSWAEIKLLRVTSNPDIVRIRCYSNMDVPGEPWEKSMGMLFAYRDEDHTKRYAHQEVGIKLRDSGKTSVYRLQFASLGEEPLYGHRTSREAKLPDLKYMLNLVEKIAKEELD